MSLLGIQDYDTHHICICRACHHNLTYNSTKPNYIPRFMKISNKCSIAQEKCTVTGCSNQADFKSADSINFEDIPGGMELGLPNNSITPSLCANHYYKVYKHQHKKQKNCTTCSAKPKPLEKFNRHSPNLTGVEKYLCASRASQERFLMMILYVLNVTNTSMNCWKHLSCLISQLQKKLEAQTQS